MIDFVLLRSRFPRTSFENSGASPEGRILDRGGSPRKALRQTPNSHCWGAWSPYNKDIRFGDGRLPVPAVYEGEQITPMRLFPSLHHRRGAQARQRAASREGGEYVESNSFTPSAVIFLRLRAIALALRRPRYSLSRYTLAPL